jgi:predicted amidohydrolase
MIYLTRLQPQPPAPGTGVRLAVYQNQGGPIGNTEAIAYYLAKMEEAFQGAQSFEAQLISFAELYLTGYALSPQEVHQLAIAKDGEEMAQVGKLAQKYGIAIICPYPEKAIINGEIHYYDSINLFNNQGNLLKTYRKTHLWGPDEGKIYSQGHCHKEEGEAFTVHKVNGFPIGLLNCYEAEFAELSRILALRGAKLVVIPTAADVWTLLSTGERTKMPYPDVSQNIIPVRALENVIFVAYCNRAGGETRLNGQGETVLVGEYLGNSVIAGPHGDILLQPRNEETLLIADCVPGNYGSTHPENTNYLADRRPNLYGALIDEIGG